MKIRDCYALMVFALMPAVVLLSSCSNGECAAGASMPSMSKLGIPSVEGSTVCKSSEKFVSFLHHDSEAGQLLTAYTNNLRRAGWVPSAKQSKEPGYEAYEKGTNKLMITAKRCASPGLSEYFSTCTIVNIWDDTE